MLLANYLYTNSLCINIIADRKDSAREMPKQITWFTFIELIKCGKTLSLYIFQHITRRAQFISPIYLLPYTFNIRRMKSRNRFCFFFSLHKLLLSYFFFFGLLKPFLCMRVQPIPFNIEYLLFEQKSIHFIIEGLVPSTA